jgi:hypothetical protein
MGSIVGSVGAKGGVAIPLPGSSNAVLTSIYLPTYPVVANTAFFYVAFEFGWRSFQFQLNPTGGATAMTCEVNVTLDPQTAQGLAQNWQPVPMPGTATVNSATWFNPMTGAAGQQMARVDSGPWVAFQLVGSGGNANSQVFFGASA